MQACTQSKRPLHVVSIAEAITITGPMKAFLAFSRVLKSGLHVPRPICLYLLTTRRPSLHARPQEDPLRTAAQMAGVKFLAIQERRLYDFGVLARACATLDTVGPDIVETHDYKSHLLFFLMRARHRQLRQCRWIAFHHGYTRISPRVLAYQQLDRLTLRFADKVVTMCRPFVEVMVKRGVNAKNVNVITNFTVPRPNPTSASLARARAAMQAEATDCVIISVGRLSREKGHADLIRAFGNVFAQSGAKSLRLVLVGDGPERARLVRLAASLGSNVVFTGHLADPWEMMHAADIFALPSHSEGSPNVVFEAAAARRPIVATSVGNIPDVLQTEVSALLVPPAAPLELATALRRLVSDEALRVRIGDAGWAALSKHTPTTYASRLIGIYEDLLRERPTAR